MRGQPVPKCTALLPAGPARFTAMSRAARKPPPVFAATQVRKGIPEGVLSLTAAFQKEPSETRLQRGSLTW